MAKYWIGGLLGLLLLTNAFWFYAIVDQGISFTYLEASLDAAKRDLHETRRLANLQLIGQGADNAKSLIGESLSGLEPFEKEGCLYVDQVCLRLDQDRNIVRPDSSEQ